MKRFLRFAASLLLLAGAAQGLNAADYFARDFGAVPDGFTLNTVSIQAAIDFVSAQGGGPFSVRRLRVAVSFWTKVTMSPDLFTSRMV